MKAIRLSLLLWWTAICARCASLQLPEPPQQHRPWLPDPAIPTNILSAAETIYEQGFPDPRGCEYREIEVAVSGVWGGKVSVVKTRGWVLPKESGSRSICDLLERADLSRHESLRACGPPRRNCRFKSARFPALWFERGSAVGEIAPSSMRMPFRRVSCCCCAAVKQPPR